MTDIEDCWLRGLRFENSLIRLFTQLGFPAERASAEEDRRKHIDVWATGTDGIRHSFDAKAMRSLSRGGPLQDAWVAVEWRGSGGGPGSIYGAQEFFAFERLGGVLIVVREDLLAFSLERVALHERVDRADYALYKTYSRRGRDDLISWVNVNDLPHQIKRELRAPRLTVPCT
jgi:hypothetical protein